MSYDYTTQRPHLLTEDGLHLLLDVRDSVHGLLKQAGAFTAARAWAGIHVGAYDSFDAIAALDLLVERGEIECLTPTWAGQDRAHTQRVRR